MFSLKVTTIGSGAGITLPDEAIAHLNVREGDTLFLTEAPDGGYRLTSAEPGTDPDQRRQMLLAERIMRDDETVLRALAR